MKALIYSRVSTSHHQQNPEVQVEELKRYCVARNWEVANTIIDHGYSGGTDQRPGFKELMALARARKVDVILVTKMDRLFRSLKHLVTTLEEFQSLGVKFVAVNDNIDYTTPSGRLMVGILGSLSEFERSLIRERTMQGLDHARRKGKVLGRPVKHDYSEIKALRAKGLSYRAISKELDVPMGCITLALRTG